MLLSLSLLGIFLSVLLLYFNAWKYKSSISLGLFFFLVSLYGFIQYAVLYSKSIPLVGIIYINLGFLPYLIGPSLYIYVRSILTDRTTLTYRDLWNLGPSAIFLIASCPYIFSPWSQKVYIAAKVVSDPGFIGMHNSTLLHGVLTTWMIYLSRPLLVLAYTLWSGRIFLRYLKEKEKSQVFSHQHYMIQWLSLLLGITLVLVVSHTLILWESFFYHDIRFFFTMNLLQVLSGTGLTGLLILPFFFPSILYGLPRFSQSDMQQPHSDRAMGNLKGDVKKEAPGFESEYLQVLEQKIETTMKELMPYLQPDCNLAYLSKLTGVPAHHLAYFFREQKKQPFNEYRNEWRVSHSKNLILEGRARGMTLEAIGLLSGFSTRNTFYTSFKKIEGITPHEFLSRVTM
ncbi:MAG: helix-turn-helix domain-containing protein [Bacteroidetes bacterium]|nr:helix-turn-helix domain-containing protein [Bacteroidota bacterium]